MAARPRPGPPQATLRPHRSARRVAARSQGDRARRAAPRQPPSAPRHLAGPVRPLSAARHGLIGTHHSLSPPNPYPAPVSGWLIKGAGQRSLSGSPPISAPSAPPRPSARWQAASRRAPALGYRADPRHHPRSVPARPLNARDPLALTPAQKIGEGRNAADGGRPTQKIRGMGPASRGLSPIPRGWEKLERGGALARGPQLLPEEDGQDALELRAAAISPRRAVLGPLAGCKAPHQPRAPALGPEPPPSLPPRSVPGGPPNTRNLPRLHPHRKLEGGNPGKGEMGPTGPAVRGSPDSGNPGCDAARRTRHHAGQSRKPAAGRNTTTMARCL